MAPIDSFHYVHGRSFLHTLDERFKIILVLVYSSVSAFVKPAGLGILGIALIVSFGVARIHLMHLVAELKGFLLFIVFVFLLAAYSIADGQSSVWIFPLPSEAGTLSALLVASRIMLVLLAGVIFFATTNQTRLIASSRALIGKVPFVPASLVSTMMGLAVMFVPVLLDLWKDVSDAQRSRCADRIRNPVRKIVASATPLIIHVLTRAEEIAEAMESRCYDGEYTLPVFRATRKDLIVFSCGIAVCALAILAGFLI